MNDEKAPAPIGSEPEKRARFGFLTGTTTRVATATAFLVAMTTLLSQIPLLTSATKSAYCNLFFCSSPEIKQKSDSAASSPLDGKFESVSNESLKQAAITLSTEFIALTNSYHDTMLEMMTHKEWNFDEVASKRQQMDDELSQRFKSEFLSKYYVLQDELIKRGVHKFPHEYFNEAIISPRDIEAAGLQIEYLANDIP